MTVEDFIEQLRAYPRDMEVVCGALGQDDQYVRAAPWEPEAAAIAGVGVKRAVVIGTDFGQRGRGAMGRGHRQHVTPQHHRAGKGGLAKGAKVKRLPQ